MSATLTAGFDMLCDELLGQLSISNHFYAHWLESLTLNEAADNDREASSTFYNVTTSSEPNCSNDKEGPDSSFA